MAKRKSVADRKAEEVSARLAAEREADRAARSERMRKVWAQRRGESAPAAEPERPKGTVPGHNPRQSAVQTETATATAKELKTAATQDRAIAKRLCKAQSTVRYPKDHEDEALRGQPVLDADGARQYKPCERPPMHGQNVCQKHGGMAPQAQAAAKLRLLQATEPLIAELIAIARDTRLPAADRTRAINSALDRAGFRGGVDVNVEVPGWQRVLQGMFGRDDPSTQDDVVEAEVVDPPQLSIAELRAAMGHQPEKYEPDPRDRPDYVNGDEEMPQGWQRSFRQRRVRR